ncbi:MAG TPA: fibronectin-binding protein EfbA [Candidatus Tetragenococcus pullicola]|nr:fibronectin-binding protein EfbA [Candidatus Tetragenococcus pullicola]
MSFDGVFTHLMVNELKEKLVNGRISKIQQPYENEIVLTIRANRKNQKLLLSAHPSYARVQLTEMTYINPETPPNFVMMLRKYLDGAILQSIQQIANDRVIHFTFKHRNELGDLQDIVLIVELMGRHSTVLLMNKETGKILDVIKHIGSSQNTYRLLLPGADYIAPPKQNSLNPFQASDTEVFERLTRLEPMSAKALQQQFQGLGRDTAEEIIFRLQESPNEKLKTWQAFFKELIEKTTPCFIATEKKEFFTPIAYRHLAEQAVETETFSSLSLLLDRFYHEKAQRDRVRQQGNELLKKIENELKRNRSKLEKRQATLKESENAEIYREKGELLTTFMYEVPRGVDSVVLANYYDEDRPLKITLDPALTPSQNAQKYFQRYQKLRNAVKLVHTQIRESKEEIDYLESVQDQLELADPTDLPTIREELTEQGYLKVQKRQKKKKQKKSQPARFTSSDQTELLVGKNNLQNDRLTLKTARKTDYWLHAKNIPGSHVIIKSNEPSETTILEAAELAAYFSKYRFSAQVPVDLVQVKHIHKPNGAKPGYVIYENQTTYYVTPHEETIKKLSN